MKEIDAPWYYTFEKHKTTYPIIAISVLLFVMAMEMHDDDIVVMVERGQAGVESLGQLYLNIANHSTLHGLHVALLIWIVGLAGYAIIVKIAQGKIRRDNPFAF